MIKEKQFRGLFMRNGTYHINKMVQGVRIYKNTKAADLEAAQKILQDEIARVLVPMTRHKEKLCAIQASDEWRAFVEKMLESNTSWISAKLKMLKARGKANGKGCSLTPKELANLLLECDGVCTVTGIPFSDDIPSGAKRAPFSMSIDRIDSSRGYHYDNCRIVCLITNLAMSNWGAESWIRVAKAMMLKELQFK